MMRLSRMLPHPLLSFAIFGLWLVLAPAPGVGHALLGLAIAFAIPYATQRFWPNRPLVARPSRALRLIAVVLTDIVAANWQVARLVLGPIEALRPAFVSVPLDIDDPFVATILGSIVSLTPGSVAVEIDRDARELLVHALDVDDPHELVVRIKARYEAPLKEIFGC
jgi:multicomponent K+:H+ antiporter subunit E